MKININNLKLVPKSINSGFQLCVYGDPNKEVSAWIINNGFNCYPSGAYTNINIPDLIDLNEIFESRKPFDWMDGFSPNLNKKLHIGHFSNLVLAKAFKSLGVANETVSIYGDTPKSTSITIEEAEKLLHKYLIEFDFIPNKIFMASEMVCKDNTILKEGEGDYAGTKVFDINGHKIVGGKSDGSTTYFYQDVALAQTLNAPTLYLTGKEQSENHFNYLKEMFPHIEHIGLGLVKVSGQKMASRVGNVILMEDFIAQMKKMLGDHDNKSIDNYDKQPFEYNMALIYNVFAGYILKSNPEIDKNINMDLINNPKNSAGLYLSYTTARLHRAGCMWKPIQSRFNSMQLNFLYHKAKENLKPNILFDGLIDHCKTISLLYDKHTIRGNDANRIMFNSMLSDLVLGCSKLGLYVIKNI